ncbi:filamentous haemagglutinin family protein [Telmatospirillum siberiense]|uniref:Filamentous haemagglutinin FhaB/tRNA nuclease CdiA-like TPS domain-containing protein n=1 Tax=Telmatospirillum siberiense TaxID=382514 RepID=A0A2N3PWY9_9PROT|nr:filamentous haemagglutinin family protein [Telmatospirillum siberiense]PKU24901.1 hypothetical protein CWS72_08455 [Telmatospirillum siberiense]
MTRTFHRHRSHRRMLLAGVSVFTLLIAAGPARAGHFSSALATTQRTASTTSSTTTSTTTSTAQVTADLTKAATSFRAAAAAQVAARAAAASNTVTLSNGTTVTVTEGLSSNGLVPDSGLAGTGVANGVTSWTNVDTPTQTSNGDGTTTVTVKQTAAKAIANWTTFNVGKNTTLYFNQSAGTASDGSNDWVVLNRITGNAIAPSVVLGTIKAEGSVYVVNQNGIVFGGSSQVNVHTLIASSLWLNQTLYEDGILNNPTTSGVSQLEYQLSALSTLNTAVSSSDSATYSGNPGDIVVEAGAQINAVADSAGNGGRVLLAGANVTNDGIISTPKGQTILAAGLQVLLAAHDSSDASIRGLDAYVGAVSSTLYPTLSAGTVINNGIVAADEGNITLTGASVYQNGVLEATTSVSLNGSIGLYARYGAVESSVSGTTYAITSLKSGLVEFGAGSLTTVLPEIDSTATYAGSSLVLSSQIDVLGHAVYLADDAMLLAPAGKVTIKAGTYAGSAIVGKSTDGLLYASDGQIYLDNGAIIDVAGLVDVEESVADTVIAVQLLSADLADSPLQRDGILYKATVYVDLLKSGTYDGTAWIGTPVADVSGYADLVNHTVAQLSTNGGTVTLSAGDAVILKSGSLVNVSGGSIAYQGGYVHAETYLETSGGVRVAISNATPDIVYDAILGSKTVSSTKWGTSETFTNRFLPGVGTVYRAGFVQGGDGGSLSITTTSPVLDGTLLGSVITGEYQTSSSSTWAETAIPTVSTLALTLQKYTTVSGAYLLTDFYGVDITIDKNNVLSEAADFTYNISSNSYGTLDDTHKYNLYISSDVFGSDGFEKVTIVDTLGSVTVPAGVTLQPQTLSGSGLSITAHDIDIAGDLIYHGGTVTLNAYSAINEYARSYYGTSYPVDPTTVTLSGTIDVSGEAYDLLRDDYRGPMVTSGGTVTIYGDLTDLTATGAIDVSGGAKVSAKDVITYGNAGSISVEGQYGLTLDATLSGYAGEGATGGSLTLIAPGFQIGGTTAYAGNVILLSSAFFSQGGFSSFTIEGYGQWEDAAHSYGTTVIPGLVVADDTVISPQVVSERLEKDTGTFATYLDEQSLRSPVNLTLKALGKKTDVALTGEVDYRGDLVIGKGVVVDIAPGTSGSTVKGGSVSLGGGTVTMLGDISVPGGSVSITGGNAYKLNTHNPSSGNVSVTVYLGADSVISTAGATVLTTDIDGFTTGTVLSGGSIALSGDIYAESGSVLDVSGAIGTINVADSSGSSARSTLDARSGAGSYLRTTVESGGGTITLAGNDLLLVKSTLLGSAGGDEASGGTLNVSSGVLLTGDNGQDIASSFTPSLYVTQDDTVYKGVTLVAGNGVTTVDGVLSGLIPVRGDIAELGYFSADQFNRGGFSSLVLGGTVRFSGDVAITASGSIKVATGSTINSGTYTSVLYADGNVVLNAPYVALGSTFGNALAVGKNITFAGSTAYSDAPSTQYGGGSLTVNATTLIDVGNLILEGVSTTSLTATGGDIRGYGTLDATGTVTLTANQVYVPTSSIFKIIVNPGATSVGMLTILPSGVGATPLSAGGEIDLYASVVDIEGTLRAPIGTIQIGYDSSNPTAAGTSSAGDYDPVTGRLAPSVTTLALGGGSVLSVSADGKTIPYGEVSEDGVWSNPLGVDITASGVSGKTVKLYGATIDSRKGSEVDISGSGDLYAYTWVEGNGGTTDVLAASNQYAIIPNYGSGYAPLSTDSKYSDSSIGVGTTVYLSGIDGLASGYYTLLPARYALLSGAYLVSVSSGSVTRANADGSAVTSGYVVNAFTGKAASSTATVLFTVTPSAVVRTESKYTDYSANTTLAAGATAAGDSVPRLPKDGGILQITAGSLTLSGSVLSSGDTANSGYAGLVEISGSGDIAIVDGSVDTSSYAAGTLILSASQLNAFGAETLLIGGISNSTNVVTVKVATITVDDANAALTGPDIILVSEDDLILKDGARIEQKGTLSGAATSLTIGRSGTSGSGDGVALRVSSDAAASVSRLGTSGSTSPILTIGANVVLAGLDSGGNLANAGSVILNSSAKAAVDSSLVIKADTVELAADRITLVLDNAGTLPAYSGITLAGDKLVSMMAAAKTVVLTSYGSIDIYGSGSIGNASSGILTLQTPEIRGYDNGGGVTLNAETVTLGNSAAATAAGTDATATGGLTINSATLTIDKGDVAINQFTGVTLAASKGLLFDGAGNLTVGSDLTISTPEITATAGSKGTLTVSGALTVNTTDAATAAVSGGLAAYLTLTANTISVSGTDIVLPSGSLTLEATTGGISIADGATLSAAGEAEIYDDYTLYSSGGYVKLIADKGSVALNGGTLSVTAQSGGGSAGTLLISAPNGIVSLNGSLLGAAGSASGTGGGFYLDVGSLASTAAIDALLNGGGFTALRDYRVRTGDVAIDGTAKAASYTLSADAGGITVTGTGSIDASGATGGAIYLAAAKDVVLQSGAKLDVSGSAFDDAGKGGRVDLETEGKGTLGIDIEAGSIIDLSVNGAAGGTLYLRAPRTAANTDVLIAPVNGTIRNASAITVEAYKIYTATDGSIDAVELQAKYDAQDFLGTLSGGVLYDHNGNVMSDTGAAIKSRLFGTNSDSTLKSVAKITPGVEIDSAASSGSVSVSLAASSGLNTSSAFRALTTTPSTTITVTFTSSGTYTTGSGTTSFAAGDTVTLQGGTAYTIVLAASGTLSTSSALTATAGSTATSIINSTNTVNGRISVTTSSKIVVTSAVTLGGTNDNTLYYIAAGSTTQVPIASRGNGGTLVPAGATVYAATSGYLYNRSGSTITVYSLTSSLALTNNSASVTIRGGTSLNGTVTYATASVLSAGTLKASDSGYYYTTDPSVKTTFSANATFAVPAGATMVFDKAATVTITAIGSSGTVQLSVNDTVLNLTNANITTTSAGTSIVLGTSVGSGTYATKSVALPAGTYTVTYESSPSFTVGSAGYYITPAGTKVNFNAGDTLSNLAAGTTITLNSSGTVTTTAMGVLVLAVPIGTTLSSVSLGYAATTETTSLSYYSNPALLLGGDLTLGNVFTTTAADLDLSTWRFGTDNVAGTLTLRSAGNIRFYNSLTDGFTGTLSTTAGTMYYGLTAAGSTSWTYRIVAGADLGAANYRDVLSLAELASGKGSVLVGKTAADYGSSDTNGYYTSGTSAATSRDPYYNSVSFYQVIRTGTGDIGIYAGRDVELLNPFTAIYTAGTQVVPDATLFDTPVTTYTALLGVGGAYQTLTQTAAQYSQGGGNVTIVAQNNIERLTDIGDGVLIDDSTQEMPTSWLNRRSYVDTSGNFTTIPCTSGTICTYQGDVASTTWWVDFSNFYEGVGALGGGNVVLKAGNDIRNVDAVVPTNAWMTKTTTVNGMATSSAASQILTTYGGGDLTVVAGGDISGGVYYVEDGTGLLKAGGSITTNASRTTDAAALLAYEKSGYITALAAYSDLSDSDKWLPTTLFLGTGSFTVEANGDVLIGSVANVFGLPQSVLNGYTKRTYFTTYDESGSVTIASLAGDVTLENDGLLYSWYQTILGYNSSNGLSSSIVSGERAWLRLDVRMTTAATTMLESFMNLMPSNLTVEALSGDIDIKGSIYLAPSSTGSLSLFAADTINGSYYVDSGSKYSAGTVNESEIVISDADPGQLNSITNPVNNCTTLAYSCAASATVEDGTTITGATNQTLAEKMLNHASYVLHKNDSVPVRIYAKSGDITGIELFSPKATRIIAGGDITDIAFYIQNINASDVSLIAAGGTIVAYDANATGLKEALADYYASAYFVSTSKAYTLSPQSGDIQVAGPGTIEVLAGDDVNLGVSTTVGASSNGTSAGIVTIGNESNPYLSDKGSSIILAAGLTGGTSGGLSDSMDFSSFIAEFLNPSTMTYGTVDRVLSELGKELGLSDTSSSAVWSAFGGLSETKKEQWALDAFFLVLRDAGRDHNDSSAANRGYQDGYSAIKALFSGNSWKGDVRMTSREIKTSQGGDISILVPGGSLSVGYSRDSQPQDQGIITEGGGNIDIFTSGDMIIGTSRVFTLDGGDVTIWSTYGDIAAGAAGKSVKAAPPSRVKIDPDTGSVESDLSGLVTGGGIGVLAALPGVTAGDVDLIAPNGVVDAGDAGIRSTGNISIAALQVLNSWNIQASGSITGVPVAAMPNLGGLMSASNAAGQSAAAADEASKQSRQTGPRATDLPSIITIEVIGYGGAGADDATQEQLRRQEERRRNDRSSFDDRSYDPYRAIKLVGNGHLTEVQKMALTEEEISKLEQLIRQSGSF